MSLTVVGAGAFGTALAIALARDGTKVTLWSRDADDVSLMAASRVSGHRLPGVPLPESLEVSTDRNAFEAAVCLLAIPAQSLSGFLSEVHFNPATALVACAKGIDRTSGLGPVGTIRHASQKNVAGIITGPSFAVDIAQGLPTALVLATTEKSDATTLQAKLTRPNLRLYRSTDVIGAELGGALKNVIAIAAGIAIGAGLGDSARASVIARGFAELSRFATAKGAKIETVQGLSGLGDLVLTCTSPKSRNFAAGVSLGAGNTPEPGKTIEGLSTAQVVADEAQALGLEVPLIQSIADVVEGQLDIPSAIETLLARPVGTE